MIHLSATTPLWLIEPHQVTLAFVEAISEVRSIYRKSYPEANRNTSYKKVINALDSIGPITTRTWNLSQISEIMGCCFWGGNKLNSLPEFKNRKNACNALTSFFKCTFILMWGKKQVMLPLNFNLPVNQDAVLDLVTEKCNSRSLELARCVNPNSKLVYKGTMTKEERVLRANAWNRAILSTNVYQPEDLSAEDIRELYWASTGARGSVLQRYYIKDLLTYLGKHGSKANAVTSFLEAEHDAKADQKLLISDIIEKDKADARRKAISDHTLLFLQSKNHTVEQLAEYYSSTALIRKSFTIPDNHDLNNIRGLPPGYKYTTKEIRNLCMLVSKTYASLDRKNQHQNPRNRRASLQFLLCYCALYLYAFYKNRDGHLENYPKTLNDLFQPCHFTADSELLEGITEYEIKQPQTYLEYFDYICEINKWSPETRNQRIGHIEDLHVYIETNNLALPHADKVRNSFNKTHYARIKRRSGTIKKSIPRVYFATFISMLYSLEYLVMHLNEMASGTMPGVLNDTLVMLSASTLSTDPLWDGLWGKGELSCEPVDLSVLNYCPIVYHDDKPHPLLYIPRFYRITRMNVKMPTNTGEIAHVNEPRVITNDIRLTQLMCETGIRQHHLIWLDRDAYDKYVPDSKNRPLAPLYVSTDKAHGPWSAIISRYVLDLLGRQRDWYDSCSDPSFDDKLWYGNQKDSPFGMLRPLFRTQQSPGSWTNYRSFRLLLVGMQYLIRIQFKDTKTRELIKFKYERGIPPTSIAHLEIDDLAKLSHLKLNSDITPHGLRAGFVSEAIKFLPPSLIGRYFTGQSENLVYYYLLLHDEGALSHDEMLCEMLMRNQSRVMDGNAPLMAKTIIELNMRLQKAILTNRDEAITTHRLMSLSRIKKAPNGLDLIRAKDVTEFAFNATHICPFNNTCPQEVIQMLGATNACALCPYAVRGVEHIPAIGAQKDQYKEFMVGILTMIQELLRRKPDQRSEEDMEKLEREHDHYARQAVMLEALELQLIEMTNNGQANALIAKNGQEIIGHYKKIQIDSDSKLLKRIIDTQNFPDLTSPDLDCRLSVLRGTLLMYQGDMREHLKIGQHDDFTPSSKAATLISSLVRNESMSTMEIYKICASAEQIYRTEIKPTAVISKYLSAS